MGAQQQTISQNFLEQASKLADGVAWRRKDRGIWKVVVWRSALTEVAYMAKSLSEAGLSRGDTVLMHSDKNYEWVPASHAIQGLGCTVLPIMPDISKYELVQCLEQVTPPKLALCEDEDKAEFLCSVFSELNINAKVFVISGTRSRSNELNSKDQNAGYSIGWPGNSDPDSPQNIEFYQKEVASGKPSDSAVILFQTGEQSKLEAISVSHERLNNFALSFNEKFSINNSDETICTVAPAYAASNLMYHVAPSLAGYCVNFPETRETILNDMREIGPTQLLITPAGYKYIAVSSLAHMQSTGVLKRNLFGATQASYQQRLNSGVSENQGLSLGATIGSMFLCKSMREVLGFGRVKNALAYPMQLGHEGEAFFESLGVRFKNIDESFNSSSEGNELMFSLDTDLSGIAAGNSEKNKSNIRVSLGEVTMNVSSESEGSLCSSPYIKRAVVVSNDSENSIALIQLDLQSCKEWADKNGIHYGSVDELPLQTDLLGLIEMEVVKTNKISAANTAVGGARQIKKFILLRRDLDRNQGELTHSRNPSYQVVINNYSDLLNKVGIGGSDRGEAKVSGKVLSLNDDNGLDYMGILIQ